MKTVWRDREFRQWFERNKADALLLAGNVILGDAQVRAPRDKGQLRNSGDVDLINNDNARISFNTEYAAIQHDGGDIGPINAKALAVPVHKTAKGRSPREFNDLHYAQRKGKPPILYRKKGKGIEVMYVLVKKVTIQGKFYLSGAVEDGKDKILRTFANGFKPS